MRISKIMLKCMYTSLVWAPLKFLVDIGTHTGEYMVPHTFSLSLLLQPIQFNPDHRPLLAVDGGT